MTQRELENEVASATGESLREIRRRGFSIVQPLPDDEPEIYAAAGLTRTESTLMPAPAPAA